MDETGIRGVRREDLIVCPHCAMANEPGDHFCANCGTVISTLGNYDYLGQIFAQGDTYRKAMNQPNSPLILLGMWLLWSPGLLLLAAIIASLVAGISRSTFEWDWTFEDFFAVPFGIGFLMGYPLVSIIILYRTTRNFVRLRRTGHLAVPK